MFYGVTVIVFYICGVTDLKEEFKVSDCCLCFERGNSLLGVNHVVIIYSSSSLEPD